MSTAELSVVHFDQDGRQPPRKGNAPGQPMHRIQEVRLQQGMTLRTASRHLGLDVRTIRAQEQESSDLRLSDLYRWQAALEVPVAELLAETEEPLSRPVMERARMVRLMKTAAALLEDAPTANTRRMAENLIEQLLEIMPELKEVGPWHSVGQRRTLDELGRIAQHPIATGFGGDYGDDGE
jgi:transcriptional regulator with XRE-family HTH domain